MSTLLFYRNFLGFSGGHLKVWDYFNHTFHTNYSPQIYFSKQSLWNESNPWFDMREKCLSTWQPEKADALFLAGMDWEMLQEDKSSFRKPIINLIQGFIHTDPQSLQYKYLKNKAIRICVSREIAEALGQIKEVNGPVFVNPNGLNLRDFPSPKPYITRHCNLLIAGFKNVNLAIHLEKHIKQHYPKEKIRVLKEQIDRSQFLDYLTQSKITIFLPNQSEGFFLPALEGMQIGTFVICPDCIGNRSFCIHEYNCLRPEYTLESIINSIEKTLQLTYFERQVFLTRAKKTVIKHSLIKERDFFINIMENIDQIW